ncbi:MAG: peroxiredoxin [Limisphaerales bacterium]|jgi:peroxiredoxin
MIRNNLHHFALAVLLFCASMSTRAADGFLYKFDFENIQDTVFYLAHHYGNQQFVVDTVLLDGEGKATISADTLFQSGMYMVVFPSLSNRYFEMVIDEPKFSVTGDVEDLVTSLDFKGSVENKIFYEDLRFLNVKREEAEPLNAKLGTLAENSAEYTKISAQLNKLDTEVKEWRKKLIERYPDMLYSKIVGALTEIIVPEPPLLEDGSVDSFFTFYYTRDHLFDNLDWNDERLIYTPTIYNQINRYLNQYTYKMPDSVAVAVDKILEKARVNNEVFKFCLISLLNDYANSNLMGMDKVYVSIALNYYAKGEAFWLDEAETFRIVDRAKRMAPTLIGNIAPNITMKDVNGKTRTLYDVESAYTVLYFWDPDCSHCKVETPALKEAYDVLKNIYNIKIFAVNTQLEIDKWLKFIDAKNLEGWYHMADFDHSSNFRSKYDINATPVLFLLNKDKEIIAKRLISDQLKDFIGVYERIHGNSGN